jgi:XTP/dITP diphosphohydrolase
MKLIFASHNEGKIIEMKAILKDLDVDVYSAEEVGIIEDVVEDGLTFAENAQKKARFVAGKSGEWAVADDSGICIEALNGEPGVYSKRWAGEDATDKKIVEYTLDKMKAVPEGERACWFESALVLVGPDGTEKNFSGRMNGTLAMSARGTALPGLMYDVIFVPDGFSKTNAELSTEEKNSISHRGKAFREMQTYIKNLT